MIALRAFFCAAMVVVLGGSAAPAAPDPSADLDPLVLGEILRELHDVRRARAELAKRAPEKLAELQAQRPQLRPPPPVVTDPVSPSVPSTPCSAEDIGVIDALRGLRKRVEGGIPYRRDERQRAIEGLLAPLDGTPVCASLWSSARVSGLVALLREELRLGQSTERFEGPVWLDNGALRLHADQLRLGLRAQYFIERGGEQRIGKVQASQEVSLPWTLVRDPAERAAIEAAFGGPIPETTRPFVVLPVPQSKPTGAKEAT